MSYQWAAIPEAVWAGFAVAVGGVASAILNAVGVDAGIIGAVAVLIAAGFRLIVAFALATLSSTGTVSAGTTPPAVLPPGGGS